MSRQPHVALFVTCLVDLFRPSVGFAAVKLLEDAGCRVSVPVAQTCCGQPAWNSGDRDNALAIAKDVVAAFRGFDHVVVPSGSCAGMIKRHLPELLAGDPLAAEAEDLAGRTHELVSFLVDVMNIERVAARLDAIVTYHDSCSGLRELGIKRQPRALLASIEGLELRELEGTESCCGFGGTFCVKYPAISTRMVGDKAEAAAHTGADLLLAGDLGCLLNIAGRLQREGRALQVRHVAEVLAGMTDRPAIGQAANAAAPNAAAAKVP